MHIARCSARCTLAVIAVASLLAATGCSDDASAQFRPGVKRPTPSEPSPAPAPAQAAPATPAPPAAQSAPAPEPAAVAAPSPVESAPAGGAMQGKVAYYSKKFAGRKTASGERFDPNAMTMAHKTLPFGTMVRVTNTRNGKSVNVRVNDRGPTQHDRIADLSYAAAVKLDIVKAGIGEARLEVIGSAPKAKGKEPSKSAAKSPKQ